MFKVFIVTILFLLLLTPQIYAQTPTPKARFNNEVKENQIKKVEERKEDISAKISFVRKERIRKYAGRMITKIEALIVRLNKLAERLETRIAKIKLNKNNLDTTQAEADLSNAKLKLTEANSKLDTIKLNLEATLSSGNPKEENQRVKTSLTELKSILKEAHLLMVHSIGELKGLRVGDSKEESK